MKGEFVILTPKKLTFKQVCSVLLLIISKNEPKITAKYRCKIICFRFDLDLQLLFSFYYIFDHLQLLNRSFCNIGTRALTPTPVIFFFVSYCLLSLVK